MPEPDLLVTKFTIPPVRSVLLVRSHLLEILEQSRSVPLTLLSAGAGFGKTTLLSAWANQSTSQVAWLTMDETEIGWVHSTIGSWPTRNCFCRSSQPSSIQLTS